MSKVVCIDPGHGGKDPGAVGNGLKEKDITLAIALKLGKILEENGIKVVYTRTTDKYLSLTERANISNRANADALVSIHTNSAVNKSATGLEVWTSKGQTQGDILAERIAEELIRGFPSMPFRSDKSDGDLDKEENFTVISRAKAPAALLELGFISNKQDSILQRTKQDEFANAIAIGIIRYLQINPKRKKTEQIYLSINGTTRKVNGYLKGGTSYIYINGEAIPLKAIGESLGFKVGWNQATRTVIFND